MCAAGDIMTDSDRTAIWLVDVATGKQQPLIAEGARGARWSPDGTRIAYVGKGDGGRPQIFVIWPATGRTAPITALPQGPGALAWSPDGTRIAYSRKQLDARHGGSLEVVTVATGQAETVLTAAPVGPPETP